jgi:hypothetical protein
MIEKTLGKKFDDYVASIGDKAVQDAVKKNSIITGGSIVSLLLNERVNDYDIYFRDMETVKSVAEYYVGMFNSMGEHIEIKPRVEIIGDRVKIIVQSEGVVSQAGDAADKEYAEKPEKATPYRPVFMSANAITLSGNIQLVTRFYGNPEEIHKNYDYIHCCNYWESNTKKLTLTSAALESILTKTLYYQGSLYPVCSVIRMRKFLKRGWYINAGQILKMLFQISNLDLTDIDTLEEQLTGVDAAYFRHVIDWCKKKKAEDPDFKVTAPYLISIIDKIFG